MNIVSARSYQYSIELCMPLFLRGKEVNSREGLILHLRSDQDAEGFGEVAPLPEFSKETLAESRNQIRSFKNQLCTEIVPKKICKLNGSFGEWLNGFGLNSSVRFGIESAVLNIIANSKWSSLAKMISKNPHSKVRVAGLLQGTEEEVAENPRSRSAKLRAAVKRGV